VALVETVVANLVDCGYPTRSAQIELALLLQLLSDTHLRAVIENPAALPNGHALLDGRLVEIGPGVCVSGAPAGPVLIVGSGNSLIPAVTATVQALLASCPVALRGSQANHAALALLLAGLGRAGDPVLTALLDRVHPFFLDHRDPAQAEQLRRLVRTGPFAVGNFWGGRSALDSLVADLGHNPHHPVAIAMEPLTGVAVVSQEHLADPDTGITRAARALAYAMTVLGQQMCSSPTEGYFLGDIEEAERFAHAVAAELRLDRAASSGGVGGTRALQLDRVRDRCADAGSLVLMPADDDTSWTVAVSAGESVFTRLPPEYALHIHDRRSFLELIAVADVSAVADRIAALPSAPCHRGVEGVQTVIRLATDEEMEELLRRTRSRGHPYRIVPPEHVMVRHALEPLDGRHLLSAFTRQTVLISGTARVAT